MPKRNFHKLIEERWSCGKFVCLGLDIDIEEIPASAHVYTNGTLDVVATIVKFNTPIVHETVDLTCAIKLNSAHYEVPGSRGVEAQEETIAMIHRVAPEIPIIIDGKRGDVRDTNAKYAYALFEKMQADAITINPYFGEKSLRPFFERKEKGIFVHCLSSDDGAEEFQYQPVVVKNTERDAVEKFLDHEIHHGVLFYEYVAFRVSHSWNKNDNCGLVIGAPRSDELCGIRKAVGDRVPILSPGIGTQGASAYTTFVAGRNSEGRGLIPSSSRGIIFASNDEGFAKAARRETKKIADEIHRARKEQS